LTDEVGTLAVRLRDAALAAGAGQAEALVRFTESLVVEVEKGRAEGVRRNRETACALRVLKDGRLGMSYAAGPRASDLSLIAADALAAARLVPPTELAAFPPPAAGTAPGIDDREGWAVPGGEKTALACEVEAAALRADGRVKRTFKPAFSGRRRVTALCSGRSAPVSFADTVFTLSVEAVAEDGEETQTGWEHASARTLAELAPGKVGGAAGAMAAAMLGGVPPATGEYACLFPPRVAVELLSSLASAFSAEEVFRGRSPLAGKIGERVFSPLLTLRDDASIAGRVGSVPFDDEGTRPLPRELVSAGVVQAFLHDLRTAAREKAAPTGNGFRGSLASSPVPVPSNLVLLPGSVPLDPFAAGERVARVEEVMGSHTIDHVTGDFSLGAAGFLLFPREAPVPFRNAAVAGNLFTLFADLAAVGDDLDFRGDTASPSLLAGTVVLTGM
jgi:PmbA protein